MYLAKNLPALKNLQILLHFKNGREKCKYVVTYISSLLSCHHSPQVKLEYKNKPFPHSVDNNYLESGETLKRIKY